MCEVPTVYPVLKYVSKWACFSFSKGKILRGVNDTETQNSSGEKSQKFYKISNVLF